MNSNLLKYHIAKAGYKIGDMGKLLGISQASFSTKLNGRKQFTLDEADKLIEYLALLPSDASVCFFSHFAENIHQ